MIRLGWMLAAALVATAPAALTAQEPAAAGETVPFSLQAAVGRAMGQSEEVRLARTRWSSRSRRCARRAPAHCRSWTPTWATRAPSRPPFSGGRRVHAPRLAPLRARHDAAAGGAGAVPGRERAAGGAGRAGLAVRQPAVRPGQRVPASLSGSQLLYSGGRWARRWASPASSARWRGWACRSRRRRSSCRCAGRTSTRCWRRSSRRIARPALAQAEAFLAQERLRLSAGRASDLEVLRAEVSRDNLRPQLVEAQNAADLCAAEPQAPGGPPAATRRSRSPRGSTCPRPRRWPGPPGGRGAVAAARRWRRRSGR